MSRNKDRMDAMMEDVIPEDETSREPAKESATEDATKAPDEAAQAEKEPEWDILHEGGSSPQDVIDDGEPNGVVVTNRQTRNCPLSFPVRYTEQDGTQRAAIIVNEIDDSTADLAVFCSSDHNAPVSIVKNVRHTYESAVPGTFCHIYG